MSTGESRLPVLAADLRPHLPGVEPDRTITDWGRSERVEGVADRTLLEFWYRHWFRVTVAGVEHVPAAGGALLLANRAGGLGAAGPLVAKALREEHPRSRTVHLAVEPALRRAPGLGMLLTKLGAVPEHPADVRRLLDDEGQLVLAHPESGTQEPLYRDRYRMPRFTRLQPVRAAVAAGVPIVPVVIFGGEEAAPTFVRLPLPFRILGRASLPITPTFPGLGPLGLLAYLPAKLTIQFLPPIETRRGSGRRQASPEDEHVRELAAQAHDSIQSELLALLEARASVWFG